MPTTALGIRNRRNNHWRAGCGESRTSGSEGGRRKSAPVTRGNSPAAYPTHPERHRTRRQDGEVEADWHNVVIWSKSAEAVNEYIGKGDRIYVAGRLVNNTWEGDDGQRRYRTEIHASEVVFLDSRNGNGNGGQVNDGDASDVEQTVAASPF